MAQLARREAENIQRQRDRINELKDFKQRMRVLKNNTGSSLNAFGESGQGNAVLGGQ